MWGFIAPLLAGLFTGGLSALLGRRSQNQQAKQLKQAQEQNQAQANAFAAQMQSSQAAIDAANAQATAQANATAASTAATIGPETSGKKMARLATIKTSPFGDMSQPYLGKRKLLGN